MKYTMQNDQRCSLAFAYVILGIFQSPSATSAANGVLNVEDRLLPSELSRPRDKKATIDTIMLHFCSDVLASPDRPHKVERILEIFKKYNK